MLMRGLIKSEGIHSPPILGNVLYIMPASNPATNAPEIMVSMIIPDIECDPILIAFFGRPLDKEMGFLKMDKPEISQNSET